MRNTTKRFESFQRHYIKMKTIKELEKEIEESKGKFPVYLVKLEGKLETLKEVLDLIDEIQEKISVYNQMDELKQKIEGK